jgi:preprotein translocase subunit SecA
MAFLEKLLGNPNARIERQFRATVDAINRLEEEIGKLSLDQIRTRFQELKSEAGGESAKLDGILPEAFALVRAAAQQTIGLRHFDVQLFGGIVLHEGRIAEMRTGEGKTLMATLPLALNALTGRGCHLITVNDYLARRDAGWMGPVFHALGLSVGVIVHEQAYQYDPEQKNEKALDERTAFLRPVTRQEAYACDITYGTNNEFGFDYLRDNMVPDLKYTVQRQLNFAIVDEVDSILIDEARTPLIISAPAEVPTDQYYRFAQLVRQLEPGTDFSVDEKMRAVSITDSGIKKMEGWLGIENIYSAGGIEKVHHIDQALKAEQLFHRDKEYMVKDGEIVIVDEFTGRLMPGRRYSEGLHQAIEAKEGVEIKRESQTLATITFQNYFRLYGKLAGMTGTATTEAEEFHKIYNLDVVDVPTHRPMVRHDATDLIFKTKAGKYQAVVHEIKQRHELGQPVLVGTISIEQNELLSQLLEREGVPHEVLNAKNHEREAQIIAQAGRAGAVTVATNMAGRGVDILLGGSPSSKEEQDAVKAAGGLHVLGTERHESRRIDNQLRGRSGRQGDPGSSQFFVSLEDDLMRIFGGDRVKSLMDRLGLPDDMPIENRMVARSIESAQKKVEGHNFDIRKHLVEYDDVMNKHREVIYRRRAQILAMSAEELRAEALQLVEHELSGIVSFHTANDDERAWDLDEIYDAVGTIFPLDIRDRVKLDDVRSRAGDRANDAAARTELIRYLTELAEKTYRVREEAGDPSRFHIVIRSVMLRSIDTLWIEHLEQMDELRHGISLRGYGQRDPLVEYKREAYLLFTRLMNSINQTFVNLLFKVEADAEPLTRERQNISYQAPAKEMQEASTPGAPVVLKASSSMPTDLGIGRNDPCPCGSGKKYKKCGLLNTEEHQRLLTKA